MTAYTNPYGQYCLTQAMDKIQLVPCNTLEEPIRVNVMSNMQEARAAAMKGNEKPSDETQHYRRRTKGFGKNESRSGNEYDSGSEEWDSEDSDEEDYEDECGGGGRWYYRSPRSCKKKKKCTCRDGEEIVVKIVKKDGKDMKKSKSSKSEESDDSGSDEETEEQEQRTEAIAVGAEPAPQPQLYCFKESDGYYQCFDKKERAPELVPLAHCYSGPNNTQQCYKQPRAATAEEPTTKPQLYCFRDGEGYFQCFEQEVRTPELVARAHCYSGPNNAVQCYDQPRAAVVVAQPTVQPTVQQTVQAVVQSTVKAVAQPTVQAVAQPTVQAVAQPTVQAVVQPTVQAVVQPTVKAVVQPTVKAVVQPTVKAVLQPTVIQPTVKPVVKPIVQPTVKPTVQPVTKQTVQPVLIGSQQIIQSPKKLFLTKRPIKQQPRTLVLTKRPV